MIELMSARLLVSRYLGVVVEAPSGLHQYLHIQPTGLLVDVPLPQHQIATPEEAVVPHAAEESAPCALLRQGRYVSHNEVALVSHRTRPQLSFQTA